MGVITETETVYLRQYLIFPGLLNFLLMPFNLCDRGGRGGGVKGGGMVSSFLSFLIELTCQHMGCVPPRHLEGPLAWLLISTSFEVFIGIISGVAQRWGPPWHRFSGSTVLGGWGSIALPWPFQAQMPSS